MNATSMNADLKSNPKPSTPDGQQLQLPAGDYVSPGLERVLPDHAFPHMRVGDVADCHWPFLRKEIPHNWYVDDRYPLVGFLSRDEANLLYNLAMPFRGKKAIEVGAWRGWSAAHIALADLELDLIDPMFCVEEHRADVEGMFDTLNIRNNVRLYDGYSPARISDVAVERGAPWDFIFIDGDHEGQAPLLDAAHAARYASSDAVMIFHDLVSPHVTRGLEYMRSLGWNTRVFQTMQIMGVAWRGTVGIPDHEPDPSVQWTLPEHLHSFRISGESEAVRLERHAALVESLASQRDYRADYLAAVKEIRALRDWICTPR